MLRSFSEEVVALKKFTAYGYASQATVAGFNQLSLRKQSSTSGMNCFTVSPQAASGVRDI